MPGGSGMHGPKGARQRAPKLYTEEGKRRLQQSFLKANLKLEDAPPRTVSVSVNATCTRCLAQVSVYVRSVIAGKRDWHCMCETQHAKRRCKLSTDLGRERLAKLMDDAGYDLKEARVQNGNSPVSTVCRTCGKQCTSLAINLVNGHLPNCDCRCWKTEKMVLEHVQQCIPDDVYCESQITVGCINDLGRNLRFDIGIRSVGNNEILLLIEVDGDQHFRPESWDGCITSAPFQRLLKNDLLKERYCLDNGLHLVRLHQRSVHERKSFDWRKLVDQKIADAVYGTLHRTVERYPLACVSYTSSVYAQLRCEV